MFALNMLYAYVHKTHPATLRNTFIAHIPFCPFVFHRPSVSMQKHKHNL